MGAHAAGGHVQPKQRRTTHAVSHSDYFQQQAQKRHSPLLLEQHRQSSGHQKGGRQWWGQRGQKGCGQQGLGQYGGGAWALLLLTLLLCSLCPSALSARFSALRRTALSLPSTGASHSSHTRHQALRFLEHPEGQGGDHFLGHGGVHSGAQSLGQQHEAHNQGKGVQEATKGQRKGDSSWAHSAEHKGTHKGVHKGVYKGVHRAVHQWSPGFLLQALHSGGGGVRRALGEGAEGDGLGDGAAWSRRLVCEPGCLNGGVCELDPKTRAPTCLCPPPDPLSHIYFRGGSCQTQALRCNSTFWCENQGACVPAQGAPAGEDLFSCACRKGFQGSKCQTPVTPCNDNEGTWCANGGVCVSPEEANGTICKCPSTHTGVSCETLVESQGLGTGHRPGTNFTSPVVILPGADVEALEAEQQKYFRVFFQIFGAFLAIWVAALAAVHCPRPRSSLRLALLRGELTPLKQTTPAPQAARDSVRVTERHASGRDLGGGATGEEMARAKSEPDRLARKGDPHGPGDRSPAREVEERAPEGGQAQDDVHPL